MNLTVQIQTVKDASLLVDALTTAALATDSANRSLQSALRDAREELQVAQDSLLATTLAPS